MTVMKKRFVVCMTAVVALALTGAMLAGCSNDSAPTEQNSDDTTGGDANGTTLVVGFDQSYPPYGFVGDDGEFTGFDIDLAKEVCDRNGWELQLEPIDWDAKDALLNSGSINCIWNGFTMEGREGEYTFSEPYMLNEQVVVVKADSGISSLEDLAGKIVMTQTGSAALEVLEDEDGQADLAATFEELQTIGDYNNAFMQLESGMVDAVACDLSIADYQMSAKPGVFVKLDPLSTEHYAVGFKLGDDERAEQVTETLKALDEDGVVKELCDKYAEYGISYDNWVLA